MNQKILYHGIPIVGRMPLFTADNRQAIRDDRKGQTRRLNGLEEINQDAGAWQFMGFKDDEAIFIIPGVIRRGIKLPWDVGNVRCMTEPLVRGRGSNALAYYRDETAPYHVAPVISLITGRPLKWRWKKPWLSSIHMPTEAARTVRRMTDIRVEKLQEISEEDAIAEGVGYGFQMNSGWPDYQHINDDGICTLTQDTAVMSFATLWDSINAKRGYGWDVPQWIWVVEFKQLEV